jgi:four helix bundle protein
VIGSYLLRAKGVEQTNIAEGFYNRTNRGFVQFLGVARPSIGEVRSQLFIALHRDYIDRERFDRAYELCDRISRQTYRLINYLEAKQNAEQG